MTKHTATPWEVYQVGKDDSTVQVWTDESFGSVKIAETSGMDREANAAYIVQAVNSHEALVKTLKDCRAIVASHKNVTVPDWEQLFKEIVDTLVNAGEQV